MESKLHQDEDIDSLLSAAGTFVHDQKPVTPSFIGAHSAVCASQQSVQGNVSVASHSIGSSMHVTSDPSTLTSVINIVLKQLNSDIVAACESPSSHVSANTSISRNRYPHHTTG